jgi:hypothetical protein
VIDVHSHALCDSALHHLTVLTDGLDYTATSNTVTYTAGQVMRCVTIPILEDTISEENEVFNVLLTSDDPNVSSGTPTAGVTITDVDGVTVELEMEMYPTSEGMGFVEVCVVVSEGELDREIIVTLATNAGTAEGKY